MGKPTGFKEFERQAVPYRDPIERAGRFPGNLHRAGRAPPAHAGRPLHGLRRAVLPERIGLPDRQPHPRVERPGLPGPLEATRSTGCTRPTTSPSSPAAPARPRAKARACWASPIRRSRSRTSKTRSSTAASPKVGSRRSRRTSAPASAWPSSAAARPAWPPPRSSTKSATTSPSTSGPTASAAC